MSQDELLTKVDAVRVLASRPSADAGRRRQILVKLLLRPPRKSAPGTAVIVVRGIDGEGHVVSGEAFAGLQVAQSGGAIAGNISEWRIPSGMAANQGVSGIVRRCTVSVGDAPACFAPGRASIAPIGGLRCRAGAGEFPAA